MRINIPSKKRILKMDLIGGDQYSADYDSRYPDFSDNYSGDETMFNCPYPYNIPCAKGVSKAKWQSRQAAEKSWDDLSYDQRKLVPCDRDKCYIAPRREGMVGSKAAGEKKSSPSMEIVIVLFTVLLLTLVFTIVAGVRALRDLRKIMKKILKAARK